MRERKANGTGGDGAMSAVRSVPAIPVLPAEPGAFARLHQAIKPRPEELRWMQIPWETDLWEARRRAHEAGKPILLWAMNGHPLGCV
jgi:hypothetical protein